MTYLKPLLGTVVLVGCLAGLPARAQYGGKDPGKEGGGNGTETMTPPPGSLYNPQCMMCLSGSASAQWTGTTGSFRVDHIMNRNGQGMMSGMMELGLILTPTMPVWGQPFSSMPFSDAMTLNPLADGQQYNAFDSGTVNMYGSSMPPGTYYMLLSMRQQMGGMMSDADWIVFPKKVACNGSGCSVVSVAGCTEDARTMCLIGGRYKVTSHWQNQFAGGQVSTLSGTKLTDTTAAFWLSDDKNYEYLIRINTATDNGYAWISIPSFTNVEFWIEVEDTASGLYKEYHLEKSDALPRLIYDPFFFTYP